MGTSRTTEGGQSAKNESPIVFFDGVCGVCNRFVDFLLVKDVGEVFKVSPLQGDTAKARLSADHQVTSKDPESVVLLDEGIEYERSEAILRICYRLGGIWKVFCVFKIVPKSLRDWVYRGIAKNRYRWFGKRDACRIPTPAERTRFLP